MVSIERRASCKGCKRRTVSLFPENIGSRYIQARICEDPAAWVCYPGTLIPCCCTRMSGLKAKSGKSERRPRSRPDIEYEMPCLR